eukprot:CAMPEP_0194138362 /NCGR_PEP_ID=MMETSP0152-20130528/8168_1 /TAXON_ID=1049557 /ORGANISM="Thalassiothrix antarctica, Strain L6-D1" /LENGTH=162 /DNA_ID=CAMNT_0038835791 /DNA_START=18 /DNA_END=506 /DNA_ORIENTATION=+
MLAPGLNALALLIVVTLLVIALKSKERGIIFFLKQSSAYERALSTIIVASPFWIWAAYKVIAVGDPDLGAVSFLLVVISASFLRWKKKNTLASILLILSNVLVSVNYMLPFFMNIELPFTFYVYLVFGAVYWAGMSFWNYHAYQQEKSVSTDEEVNGLFLAN